MSFVISLMNRGFAYFMRWAIHGTKNEGNCDYGGISVYTILHIGDIILSEIVGTPATHT